MTLEEMKQKVLLLVEEYNEDADLLTDDDDIGNKLNTVINQVLTEISRFKKIDAVTTMEVEQGDIIEFSSLDKFYQLNIIKGADCDVTGQRIIANETGTIDIYYYRYPTQINAETEDSQVLDLSIDALEVAVYGIAADLLKSDVSSNYGAVYAQRYQEMLSTLDSRNVMFSVTFGEGV